MGVKGLRNYLETQGRGDASFKVDLKEIVGKYRDKYKKKPEIVVDAYSSIYKIYEKIDWVCGGEYTEFASRAKDFLKCFADIGVKLVFFFDGTVQDWKRKEWVQRRMARMKRAVKVFNNLEARLEVSSISHWDSVMPDGLGYILSHIVRMSNCKTVRSQRECDDEIVLYAKKNNCMAILADDSDFVIYQSQALYLLSLNRLDIRAMTTLAYDSGALARRLQLKREDLPALASLLGNDFVSIDDLKPFHSRLNGLSGTAYLIKQVADYIRNVSRENSFLDNLKKVSLDVFGTTAKAENIRRSVLSYSPTELESDTGNCDKILVVALRNSINESDPGLVHNVLGQKIFESSTLLEDFREPHLLRSPQKPHLLPSAVVLRKMRQRIYGVLFKEYSACADSELVVKEWCMSGPNSLDDALAVPAILPPFKAPFLLDLWERKPIESKDLKEAVTDGKFKLLAWMSCDQFLLKNTNLREFPPHLTCALCALCYLYHDAKMLQESDVMRLASVVVDTQAMSLFDLSSIRVGSVDVRGIHMATLFARTITHVYFANSVCGHAIDDELMLHHQNFNGKIFQAAYLNSDPSPKKGSMADFNLLCRTVLS